MSQCSAIPADLQSYASATIDMDAQLIAQGRRLQAAIDALNQSHPDPSVLGALPSLGAQVASYASGNASTDVWVGDVGQAFENANGVCANPNAVVTTQSATIDSLVRGEEPQGAKARAAQIMKALPAGRNGLVAAVPAGGATVAWLMQNKWWLTKAWAFGAKAGVLPAIWASLKGYRLIDSGTYVIAKGQRFVTDGSTLLQKYIQSGRLPGTRYLADNPEVSKFFSTTDKIASDLKTGFNPADSSFWRASTRGAGAAAIALTLGSDIYNYGWGANRKDGFGNQFAGAVTVDGATTAGTIALSDAAGTAAGAAAGTLVGGEAGAAAGSVVPGVGTAVGFVVGVGVGYFMTTGVGKNLRNDAVKYTAEGFHDVEHFVTNDIPNTAGHVLHDLNPVNWF